MASIFWKNSWVASLILALLILFVFWPLLQAGFIAFDDPEYVSANPRIQAGLTWKGLVWAFTVLHWFYYPLTWLSHMADWSLYGPWAGGHHLSSILFHAGSTILLFLFLRRATGMGPGSLLTAALFAVHPLHVESVAWIAERKDVLSTFFLMVSLLAYDRFARGASRRAYVLSLAALACGMLSKSTVVMGPVLFVLLDGWPYGRLPGFEKLGVPCLHSPAAPLTWKAWAVEKAPFFLLSAFFAVLTLITQGGAVSPSTALPLWAKACNGLWNYALFLAKAVVPVNLAVVYPYPPLHSLPLMGAAGGALVVLGALLVFRTRAAHPEGITGWLWYLLYPLTTIGFIQVGVQGATDRTTYVALIGVFLILSWEIEGVGLARPPLRVVLAAGCVAAVVALGAASNQLARNWQTSEELFEHAIRAVPGNAQAMTLLAQTLLTKGENERAASLLEEALWLSPNSPDAWGTLGNLNASQGRLGEAEADYKKVLALHPGDSTAWFNLGGVLEATGRPQEAEGCYRNALAGKTDYLRARVALSRALLRRGLIAEARAEAEKAYQVAPGNAEVQNVLAAIQAAPKPSAGGASGSPGGRGQP